MKRLWLLVIGASFIIGSCARVNAPQEPDHNNIPANKAVLEIRIVRPSIKTGSMAFSSNKPGFVAPSVSIDSAKTILAYKEGLEPIVIKREDISFYEKQGYGLEPTQTVSAFGSFEQAHLNLLLAKELWSLSRAEGITVAVIDSGLDRRHKSMRAASLGGYNFIDNSRVVKDESGHGTAIAALIAGRGPQYGIAPQAKILPLKVLDAHNQGSNYDVTRAILFAADLLAGKQNPTPAKIINLSLGSYSYSPAMHEAIKKAVAKGIIVVAAAGNSGKNKIAFPAALPEVISVGAAQLIADEWSLMPYSNFGKYADILAPVGGQANLNCGSYAEAGLLTAKANSSESAKYVHGTSFAAAEVTAVAALLIAKESNSAIVQKHLLESAADIGPKGWDNNFAYGVLSPLAALRSLDKKEETAGKLIVELLDAVSRQEIARYYLFADKELVLNPGRYRIFAFEDLNDDGLWQNGEPYFESANLLLKANSSYKEEVILFSNYTKLN